MLRLKSQRLFVAVQAFAMLLPIYGNAAHICSELFTTEIAREKAEVGVSWKDDFSYIDAMQKRERLGQVATFFSKKWDTQMYVSNTGTPDSMGRIPLVDPNARAVVIFFHGSGTMKSSGGNFLANMNTLANLGYSSLAFDMPFHMQGPRDTKFNDSRVFMEWVRSIVLEAKKSGRPVFLAGHSFGPDVALEYVARYPKDVEGVVGLSPAGFTKELSKWYDEKTSKMNFGGAVASNDAGGIWAATMSSQFLWSKGKLADPTVVNPNLKVRILSGNREEYVPAPLSAETGLPSGENTYDVTVPLKKVLKNAVVTVEPGIGHYLFEHQDANGNNVVLRELLVGTGISPVNLKETIRDMTTAVRAENKNIHAPGQLAKKYAQDSIFRAWADLTYGPRTTMKTANQGLDALSQKILDHYQVAQKEREMELYHRVLNTKTTHPEFYDKYKHIIDKANPKVLDTSLLVPFYYFVTKGEASTPNN